MCNALILSLMFVVGAIFEQHVAKPICGQGSATLQAGADVGEEKKFLSRLH